MANKKNQLTKVIATGYRRGIYKQTGKGNSMQGMVRYFDKHTGNGLIVSDDMQSAWYFQFKNTAYAINVEPVFKNNTSQHRSKVCSVLKTGARVSFDLNDTKHVKTPTNITAI